MTRETAGAHDAALVAITREVSASIGRCELTHLQRAPIDVERARVQHRAYESQLAALGCRVHRLPSDPNLPDSVFVEDIAIVLDEVAIITRPGAASRRAEIRPVADALRAHRSLRPIEAPGTLDGGDVLIVDETLYVGQSTRTNADGIGQLRKHVEAYGYRVVPVAVRRALHLTSGVTRVGPRTLVINPDWVDTAAFADYEQIPVAVSEAAAGNALLIGDTVLCSSAYPRTRARLDESGIRTVEVDASEIAKAEGALTCCSLIFRSSRSDAAS